MKKIIYDVLNKIENVGFEAYLVGGYPRDFYLNKISNDYDICTNATPEDLKNIFSEVIEENYGSLKILYEKEIFEITTFRLEKNYISVRTPVISYTNSLEEDLTRRDFIMNTLCMDKNENYIDYMGAKEDIDNKVIRAVGNPIEKMREDPLRILRAMRFATTLNFSIEESLENAIIENVDLVSNLSYYRRKEELDKILSSSNCLIGMNLLKKYGLDLLLECTYSNIVYVEDLEAMWAQIDFSSNYPFSKKEKENIDIIRILVSKKNIEDIDLYYYGLSPCISAAMILENDIEKLKNQYKSLPIYSKSDIKITVNSIKEITTIYPSTIYTMLEKKIIGRKLNNNLEDIEKYLKEYFVE